MFDFRRVLLPCLLVILCLDGYLSSAVALNITQVNPTQFAKNHAFSIPLFASPSPARWLKVLGPDWVNVNPKTGTITGITPNIGEAHYVRIKAASGAESYSMTFILIVGNQNVYRMDGSAGNPSTLAESYGMMSGGDVLIIPSGTYSGDANTFNGDAKVIIKSGTAFGYTTWIAEYPGQVVLPSVLSKGAEYVAYKGFSFVPAQFSSGMIISGEIQQGIRSNHVKVMMCSTQDGGFAILLGAQYVLIEDSFVYGDLRAGTSIWSGDNSNKFIIFRRVVVRQDYTTSIEPTAMFMHYGGENILYQNSLAIDQAKDNSNFAAANGRFGAFETKNGRNVFIKDSMAFNIVDMFHFGDTQTDNIRITNGVFWDIGTGSQTKSPNTQYDNLTIANVNAQNSQNTFNDASGATDVFFTDSLFYDIEGTGTDSSWFAKKILYNANESSHNLFYPIQADITIGDPSDIIIGIDPLDGSPGNGIAGLRYPIRIEKGSDLDAEGIGATILYKRGKSGTLWGEVGYDDLLNEPLWPWNNESGIKSRMAVADVSSGGISVVGARGFAVTGESLTNYIWGYLGNTVPPLNVQALSENGKIVIHWDPPAAIALATITGFKVYDVSGNANPQVPGNMVPVAIIPGNTTYSSTITGLIDGAIYNFAVTSVDSVKGESSYSYIVSTSTDRIPPSAPTGLVVAIVP